MIFNSENSAENIFWRRKAIVRERERRREREKVRERKRREKKMGNKEC